jgi:hypothetical protein
MKKCFVWATMLLCSAFAVFAAPVTFQVDLAPQINLGAFDPSTDVVEVRGSFNDWSGGFALTRVDSTSTIYTGSREIPGDAGSNVEFKFVKVVNGGAVWESTPNRVFALSGSAQTLPISYFENVWEGGSVPVTFQVNMATQQAAGSFDPAAGDFLEVRGSFNNWSGGFLLSPSEANPAIYVGTADVPQAPGARVEYKFVINRGVTGQVVWENDPNRAFTQTAEPQTLPVVYFNNVTGVPVKAIASFQVDMSVQIAAGNFDPATQEVYIRGNKFGWGNPPEGIQLFADPARPGIYTNIFKSDTQLTGDRIEYKAVVWTPDTSETRWEDGANKVLVFEGNEPKDANGYLQAVVGPYYFNGVAPGDILNAETVVTFRVDMRNAHTTGGAAFDPTNDTLSLNGSFLTGGWQPWDSLTETQAFDDGQSGGDTVAGDGIYSVQVTLPRGASTRLEYKYGINGADNEAAVGSNHVRYVRTSGSYTLPVDVFGTMTQEPATQDLGKISIARGTAGKVVLSWAGQPGVRLQKLTSLVGGTISEVPGTDGLSSYEYTASESMAFFRLVKP